MRFLVAVLSCVFFTIVNLSWEHISDYWYYIAETQCFTVLLAVCAYTAYEKKSAYYIAMLFFFWLSFSSMIVKTIEFNMVWLELIQVLFAIILTIFTLWRTKYY